jgi:hypothetical protein
VQLINAPDLLGVRMTATTHTTEVYFNLLADGRRMHSNSNSLLEGWESDAYLLAVSRPNGTPPDDPDQLSRLLVIGGSYVRRGDVVILDSLSKVDALVVPNPKGLRIAIHGQPTIELGLRCNSAPAEVVVNGSPIPFEYSVAGQRVRCKVKPEPKTEG